jgi:MYXO-CTERM domain-containing protein
MRIARTFVVASVLSLSLSLGGAATAQSASSAASDDVEAVEAELDAQHDKLRGFDAKLDAGEMQAEDCSAICDYLVAMGRTVERLCKLAPGPRCEAARSKLEAARQRVLKACPECEGSGEEFVAKTKKPAPVQPTAQPGMVDEELAEAPAPPSEDASGAGCAGCATVSSDDDGRDAGLAAILLLAGVVLRRRRRR